MKTLQFKIELLSDIVLSQNSGTKGNKETLDFIPGSNFLGIVAKEYDSFNENKNLVFHSSRIRFGDAHPMINNNRALRKPAGFHNPKLDESGSKIYIHHLIPDFNAVRNLQLKQMRSHFYAFTGQEAVEYKASKSFAIKSAYDREKRRSKDEQMYGYQSIEAGSEYCFELNIDDEVESAMVELIKTMLIGKHTIGRSRTAQYGLVNIEEYSFNQPKSDFSKNNQTVIYAESRLIFRDEYGNLTYAPNPGQFGIKGGKIDWNKSQIRTFAYSPWNFKRSAFDSERKGIEKGSVIVIEGGEFVIKSEFVGLYQNEGFGKVIFNPDFLKADKDGISRLKFNGNTKEKAGNEQKSEKKPLNKSDDLVYNFLIREKQKETDEKEVYKLVNDFVRRNKDKFMGERFASQWGTIRSLAMQYPNKAALERELFTKTTTRNNKKVDNAYLTHGVAKEKWSERGRKKAFLEFFNAIPEHMIQFAIVNLAAEMAKKSEGK